MIDTAGLEDVTDDSLQGRMRRLTERAVDMADVCLFLIDGRVGVTPSDEVFADILGMPTVWVPHSYAACSQHAPNEHLLAPVAREALRLMTGLFWDLGEQGRPQPG